MQSEQRVILDSVEFNRVMFELRGHMENIDKTGLKIFFLDYNEGGKFYPETIKFDGDNFFLSMNIMGVKSEMPKSIELDDGNIPTGTSGFAPMENGEWSLAFCEKGGNIIQAVAGDELVREINRPAYKESSVRVNYYKNAGNFFTATSMLDPDNGEYYLKVECKFPDVNLTEHQKKRIAKKRKKAKLRTDRRHNAFVTVYNIAKKFHKRKGNRILFTSDSRAELGGNLEFVYNRMVERGLTDDYKIDFCFKANIKDRRNIFEKFRFPVLLAKADIILLDDYQPEIYLVDYDPEVKVIQLWHACGAFKTLGFERLGKPGAPSFNTRVHKCYTHMTVSSEHSIMHHAEAFGLPINRFYPVGIARTDIFFDEEYKKKATAEVYAAFPQAKSAKEVVLYAPTFRGENAKNARFPMNMLDMNALGKYCKQHDAVTIIKMHPFVQTPLSIPDEYKDVLLNASEYREVNDILFVVDLLITDYSSVIYEFSLFNKPMLFYAFDRYRYEADRGFYEPYSELVPGKIVRSFPELIEAMENKDYEFEKMQSFVRKNFKYTDGKSTDRIIDQLILGKKE